MKGMLKYKLLAALGLIVVSCETVSGLQEPVSEGKLLCAKVVAPAGQATKSMLPDNLEGRILTVTWAAYRSDIGELIYSEFDEPDTRDVFRISCPLPEGHGYDLYALANMGDLTSSLPTDKAGLEKLGYMLPREFGNLAITGIPMAGFSPDVKPGAADAEIPLRSLVAKYRLRVNMKGLDLQVGSSAWRKVMQGEYLRVMNSNRYLMPFAPEGSAARVADDVASGDSDASFASILPSSAVSSAPEDRFFQYDLYVPENRQGVLLAGNMDPYLKSRPEIERIYGSQLADRLTYLEMSLDKTVSSDNNPFMGEVIYRMYLGQDNCSDFNVIAGSENLLSVDFDGESLFFPPDWKIEHGSSWNNDSERLEFSNHDITVMPGRESKLFVWYSGTGLDLEDAIPYNMGIRQPDKLAGAVRGEWFFEEDCSSDNGMLSFSELWASDEAQRLTGDCIRYVATSGDKQKNSDVVGRYYFKSVDENMGKTAMLVVTDRWHCMRDTCYVHFSGSITMNSQDFNNFRVAQERILMVSDLPEDADAVCTVTSGSDCVSIEALDVSAGRSVRSWSVKGLGVGNVALKVSAGGVSANFTITVLPVYLNFMYRRSGIRCPLDGTSVTDTYAYYADSEGRTELSEGSFVPELKNTLLAPVLTMEGEYAPLLSCMLNSRNIVTRLERYRASGVELKAVPASMQLGQLSVSPAYNSLYVAKTGVYLSEYRSYEPLGNIGELFDASGYESLVNSKLPGKLPASYRTHVDFGGRSSFNAFMGTSIIKSGGVGNRDLWSVRLFADDGSECRSVSIKNIDGIDVWLNDDPYGQYGGNLTARLCVRNRNSGESYTEDLFSFGSTVMVCLAGGYCNETGIYGKASCYEVPVEDSPSTFYSSVSGATTWQDPMVLIQKDEWNSFVAWGGKIKQYLTYADDFLSLPENLYFGKTKYDLSSGLCFDTYADWLGTYSRSVSAVFDYLCKYGPRLITGTVENRYKYVEFDSTAATSLALLKFHKSLYFSLLAYHKTNGRAVSDLRKQFSVCRSSHTEGVDDELVKLSDTQPYALRTQVQHVFYGDVEDGRCNNQPWRVDFNHRSPASLPGWYGNQDLHLPFSKNGDSDLIDLIGQFAPELGFSTGARMDGLTFKGGVADYRGDSHIRMFFLHDALSLSGDEFRFTWLNAY